MKKIKRVLVFFLIFSLLTLKFESFSVVAKSKNLSVEQAKKMGLVNSSSYALLESKLELAQVQRDQAVKALKLKEKNQTTFRWSPLMDFKFPEEPNLVEAFEYKYKPEELGSNIEVLEHQISDEVYQIYYKISSVFVKVYALQEKITFNEERLENYKKTLDKNRKRLLNGQANQNDITVMEQKVASIERTLISDKTSFEAQKKKLSDLIGVNVVIGYSFEVPFVDGEIDRNILDSLISYTLSKDHSCYQAEKEATNALLALNTNYNLMKKQYGSKMSMLDSYINQIKAGQKVDSAAFKLKYNQFLTAIDEPWVGTKKIWFVKIPKEWFKGDIDGVRYVEDEPYILYECALEYQDALKELESIKKEISNNVTDTFENYMSSKKAVESMEEQIVNKNTELDKAKSLNTLGKMTYEEYSAVQEEHEELQLELVQMKADYSEILYSFDRLTCGKIMNMLIGENATVFSSGRGGYSYIEESEGEGVYYYIHQIASENAFELGITVSEDAEVELTHFELWVNGIQIGTRTSLSNVIRHLTLGLMQTESVFIRIYNGDEFVDDCAIDPSVYSGKLNITKYTVVTAEDDEVGSFGVETDSNGMLNINFIPAMDEMYAYYNIMTDSGYYLISEEKIALTQDFRYLGFVQDSLDSLIINLYDENQQFMYQARFQTSDKTLRKIQDEAN